MYALDKADPILKHLFLESHGVYGRIGLKTDPSQQDLRSVEFTGTDAAADCWAIQTELRLDEFPVTITRPIYTLFDVAALDVRNYSLHI